MVGTWGSLILVFFIIIILCVELGINVPKQALANKFINYSKG
jgi:hypothetical protein